MVLQQCLNCKKRQSIKNDACNKCDADLQKCRRTRKVPYFIQYRLPDGKQRREYVGTSLTKAKDADGKRKVQKRENRIFDMLPDSDITFNELAERYLGKRKVKS